MYQKDILAAIPIKPAPAAETKGAADDIETGGIEIKRRGIDVKTAGVDIQAVKTRALVEADRRMSMIKRHVMHHQQHVHRQEIRAAGSALRNPFIVLSMTLGSSCIRSKIAVFRS